MRNAEGYKVYMDPTTLSPPTPVGPALDLDRHVALCSEQEPTLGARFIGPHVTLTAAELAAQCRARMARETAVRS